MISAFPLINKCATLAVVFFLLVACDQKIDTPFVARVGNKYLFAKELADFIPTTVSREDSSRRAKVIVNNWIREQVVLQKAKYNMRGDESKFDAKIESYLNDLIIYEFENQYVKENLDTTVTHQAMRAYYDEQRDNFILKDYILRVRYALFDAEEDLSVFVSKFRRYNHIDSIDVDLFCSENAKKFYHHPTDWVYFDDLNREIPFLAANKEQLLNDKSFFDYTENGKRYLLKIEEYKLKDSVSPFELERDKIRNTIINQRKIELLEEMRSSLFKNAITNKEIEISSKE